MKDNSNVNRLLIMSFCGLLLASIYAYPVNALDGDASKALGYFIQGDYKKALDIAIPLANNGESGAQFVLGHMAETGYKKHSADIQLAVQWYGLAAEQGLPEAKFALASIYEKWWMASRLPERIVTKNTVGNVKNDIYLKKSLELYKEAASQGYAPADVAVNNLEGELQRYISLIEKYSTSTSRSTGKSARSTRSSKKPKNINITPQKGCSLSKEKQNYIRHKICGGDAEYVATSGQHCVEGMFLERMTDNVIQIYAGEHCGFEDYAKTLREQLAQANSILGPLMDCINEPINFDRLQSIAEKDVSAKFRGGARQGECPDRLRTKLNYRLPELIRNNESNINLLRKLNKELYKN